MRSVKFAVVLALVAIAGLARIQARQDKDAKEVTDAIAALKSSDPAVSKLFASAYGYAVFPKITKAAVVVGGASGDGRVFEKNAYVGDIRVTQATVGAALGGQSFSEVIFF